MELDADSDPVLNNTLLWVDGEAYSRGRRDGKLYPRDRLWCVIQRPYRQTMRVSRAQIETNMTGRE